MENIKVSIITAAYNVEKYIGRCLDSMLNQTYKNIEIIIVDDGSKDNTSAEIEKYIKNHTADIRLIEQANGGVANARNNALNYVTGNLICVFDSDDFMNRDHIETLVSMYTSSDKIECAITGYAQYSHKNNQIIKNIESTEGIFEGRELAERLMFHTGNENLISGVNNKLYSTELIRRYDIKYDESLAYGEDWLFNINYYMHCRKVAISNHVTSNYVQYEETRLSTKFRPDGYKSSFYVIKKLYELFPDTYNAEKYLESILRISDHYNRYYVRSKGFSEFARYCRHLNAEVNTSIAAFSVLQYSKSLCPRHKALIENKATKYLLLNILFCYDSYLKYCVSKIIRRR